MVQEGPCTDGGEGGEERLGASFVCEFLGAFGIWADVCKERVTCGWRP
jgi:hypothetical protein